MPTPHPFSESKILFFDVFGTVVDWRSTVTNYLESQCRAAISAGSPALPADAQTMTYEKWSIFAEQWRNTYHVFTREYAKLEPGSAPYKNIDAHYLSALRDLLRDWRLEGLWDEQHVETVSRIWHALNPWPDSVEGLKQLRHELGFETSTLSNGNVSLLTDMARYGGLDWTHITSSEMFESYKPNPAVYLGAAKKWGFVPEQSVLVAAHLQDLRAARQCGFRTIYVEREQEEAWDEEKVEKAKSEGFVDEWVTINQDGFKEVARRLAALTGKSVKPS